MDFFGGMGDEMGGNMFPGFPGVQVSRLLHEMCLSIAGLVERVDQELALPRGVCGRVRA